MPVAEATETDLAPLGMSETVLVPALTVPENATSFAVMVMGELVDDIEVEPAFVTLPVPSVVIVTPVVPVALALRVIEPFEPAFVCSTSELPDKALLVPMPPAVSVSVPFVDVIVPDVVIDPLFTVDTEKLPPTDDAPNWMAPPELMKAFPGLPVLVVSVETPPITIGALIVPISPVPELRAIMAPFRLPETPFVMLPEPFA